jgi:hypothetical protein
MSRQLDSGMETSSTVQAEYRYPFPRRSIKHRVYISNETTQDSEERMKIDDCGCIYLPCSLTIPPCHNQKSAQPSPPPQRTPLVTPLLPSIYNYGSPSPPNQQTWQFGNPRTDHVERGRTDTSPSYDTFQCLILPKHPPAQFQRESAGTALGELGSPFFLDTCIWRRECMTLFEFALAGAGCISPPPPLPPPRQAPVYPPVGIVLVVYCTLLS